MGDDVVLQVLGRYGLEPVRLLGMQKGYRNESHAAELPDGRQVNLILYKREPGILERIRNANQVADYLAGQGLPVRRTIDGRIVRLRSGPAVKYGALYAYLPGNTIPWEAYTMAHLKLLGETMGRMHSALAELPRGTLPLATDEYGHVLERMAHYFSEPAVQAALRTKLRLRVNPALLGRCYALLRQVGRLPAQQPLHLDFVRGNILFIASPEGPAVSGILDFEKTAYGAPLIDLARTLAFLLVDCKYKPGAKVRKYFLYSGYVKRGGREIIGSHLLGGLTAFFLMHDFYKFLRHNPYEFLPQNEHFIRTRAQLVEAGILQQATQQALPKPGRPW